ncbi:MAG: integrase core domain-containing protein [Bacteroidota bacterium]|nr:integrase core domain-containing protein [Bacteroidota bacterium]
MRNYIAQGLTRDKALEIADVSKHQFYYKPVINKRGRKPSVHTRLLTKEEGNLHVEEKEVVKEIIRIKTTPELEDYGYRKVCVALMLSGYWINHKKVYRIMSTHQLLNDRHQRPPRQYAKYRKVCPKGPLEVLEMDIKYQWVEQHCCHSFILTIIDTFTRAALHWEVGYTMKQAQIKSAWEKVIVNYLQTADMLSKGVHIEIRNDNGSQFAAKMIQQFFKDNYLNQVFTHPYTPQENGHIESFHAILGRSLDQRRFFTIQDLEQHLKVFYKTYNEKRLHGSIAYLPPMMFWKLWNKELIERKEMKNNKVKFKLLIPYQQLSGNVNRREASCYSLIDLDGRLKNEIKLIRPESIQPSVQRSPLVASC